MTAQTGATIQTAVVKHRVSELRAASPDIQIDWRHRPCAGIFRRIAIADIEADFARFRVNLILLGHHLAVQAEGLVLCAELNTKRLVVGSSVYQADEYVEQSPEALDFFRAFCARHHVVLETPVRDYATLDDVKFALLDFGVTTKSLEAVSLFADSFSPATAQTVREYLAAKAPIADAYVTLRTRRFTPRRPGS